MNQNNQLQLKGEAGRKKEEREGRKKRNRNVRKLVKSKNTLVMYTGDRGTEGTEETVDKIEDNHLQPGFQPVGWMCVTGFDIGQTVQIYYQKCEDRGWRDGSAVKNTCCSSRGPEFIAITHRVAPCHL